MPLNLAVPAETARSRSRPLPAPGRLRSVLPLNDSSRAFVSGARHAVRQVLDGRDPRLLVIAGPCSVHDPDAALEYASELRELAARHAGQLLVVMRVYVEKPRSVLGWPGLISDPALDGTGDVARGVHAARRLLLDLADAGMPAGVEFVTTHAAAYLSDTVTWAAIGARTVASMEHRQLAAGLPMPVGFKNALDGDVTLAADACTAAAAPHSCLGTGDDGVPAAVTADGNPDTCVVLRGGARGPNYSPVHVARALEIIMKAGLPPRVMVDASHGNSGKNHRRQLDVAAGVAAQVACGQYGIAGVMIESFLAEGRQEPGPLETLAHGKSITDACMDLAATSRALDVLASAAADRRALA